MSSTEGETYIVGVARTRFSDIPFGCDSRGKRVEVEQFLRNHGSQFLFLGNRATRIGGSIPEESRFTIPIFGELCHL